MENLKNFNVLLAEDDSTLRDEIKETLSIFFKNVFPCENGKVALDTYNNNNIDIIFTDYVMPELDGHKFSQQIREKDKNIPIIFITNYTDKEKLLNLITLNVTDFLIKPINYDNLITSLEKLNDLVKKEEKSTIIKLNNKIKYDTSNKVLFIEDKEIKLTKNEIAFIEILVQNLNSIISFDTLSYSFGDEYKSEHAIKNIIYRLNQKVEINFLKNVQGVGYKIETTI